MLLNLDHRGKTNWVTNVRKTLCANGFSYVWGNQGVGCLNAFIREFRQRFTVESINNDNCNNENTVVTRHFSIPVFYPS